MNDGQTLGFLWDMGFGAVHIHSLIGSGIPGTVLGNILLANFPQMVLSFLYLMYNGLYTCMIQGHEWTRYAHTRKPLRVTSPVGKQRSTYYLTLPYTYAVPLLCASGLMHWLVSQSLFLVQITFYNSMGEEAWEKNISTLGYSSIAIIFVLVVASTMLLVQITMGFRRFNPGIPHASSCSAAISAACHAPADDVHAPLLPVMWGVVEEGGNGVGHCCFTSYEVTPPVKGRLYAGVADESPSSETVRSAIPSCNSKERSQSGYLTPQ